MVIQDVVTWIYDLAADQCMQHQLLCMQVFCCIVLHTAVFMHDGYQPQLNAIHTLVANNLRK